MNCFEDLRNDNDWPELDKKKPPVAAKTPDNMMATHRPHALGPAEITRIVSQVHAAISTRERVLRRVLDALRTRLDPIGARAIVTGTTAVRCTLASRGACGATELAVACPASSDLDIDVPASDGDPAVLARIRKGLDAVCADLLADPAFVSIVTEGARKAHLDTEHGRVNSCVYVPLNEGCSMSPQCALGVDVPRFSETSPRLKFGCISATRNDTLDDGVVLYRLRVSGWIDTDGGGRARVTVPFVDIKSHVATRTCMAINTVPINPKSPHSVLVPSDRDLCVELSRLLSRVYDHVDESKDDRRAQQLRLLERGVRGRCAMRSAKGSSRALPAAPPHMQRDGPRARSDPAKHDDGRQDVR
jgi:hypothetical protein